MDFFARQERSRRSTRYLVAVFGMAFLAVAVATAVVATFAYGVFIDQTTVVTAGRGVPEVLRNSAALIAVIVPATMALMILASLYRTATLSKGGGQVARMLGATQINGGDPDPLRRRLINVVEEIAIASGLPVPEIYVLEQESAINAFAAGLTPTDAAIAVTRGSLERLSRSELQGVVAHEFSHILNGDMRLNQRLIGFSFGILVLSLMGRWMLRGSRFAYRSRNRGTSAAVFIGLALTVIGGIGVLFSRLIKAAVSRQREALADASAVQFTREPSGLAGALKKIGGYTTYLTSTETEEVSHMLFGKGSRSFSGWFATHPPLDERIKALEPEFEPGDYVVSSEPMPHGPTDDLAPVSALSAVGPATGTRLESAGTVESAQTGAALRAAVPEELYHAAHHGESSFLLVLSLALSPERNTLERQMRLLQNRLGTERANRCRSLNRELKELDRRLWLPLLELSVPALKHRPAEQVQFLFELTERLVEIDAHQSLFEYVLQRLMRAYFEDLGAVPAYAAASGQRPMLDQAVCLTLGTVATFGHADAETAKRAFHAGVATLATRVAAAADGILDDCLRERNLAELDRALEVLTRLTGKAKRQVLKALLATIQFDNRVSIEEIELFRAIAATLGCPMPPTAAIR